MSEDNSKDNAETPQGSAPSGKVAAELEALLKEAAENKLKFDEFLKSSMASVTAAIGTLKTSSAEIDEVKGGVAASKVAIDAAQSTIADFAEKAKTSLAEVNDIKTEIATAKGAIEENRKAAAADVGTVSQSKANIEAIHASATALSEKVNKDYQNVSVAMDELKGEQGALKAVLKEIEGIKTAAEESRGAVTESVAEIVQSKTAFVELNSEAAAQHELLVQKQSSLQSKISEIETASAEIKILRRVLLEGSDGKKSTAEEIGELQRQINAILESASAERTAAATSLDDLLEKAEAGNEALSKASVSRFDDLFKTLESKILALLPSAGAAGLASTYYDAKSRYAPTSYAGRPGKPALVGWRKWLRVCMGNNPSSAIATGFFYAFFLVPLGALAWGTYDLIWQLEHNGAFKFDYRLIVLRFLIAVPLATVSGFGFASLQLYRKLYEEYNHKQRVMELYVSFRDEIEKGGDKEQIKTLLKIMMDSVADKAWRDAKIEPKDDIQDALTSVDKVSSLVAKIKTLGT